MTSCSTIVLEEDFKSGFFAIVLNLAESAISVERKSVAIVK
jgi:hypothetical protein